MACYHGVQRKRSCLQPIHQMPATKFCLSHSLLSPPLCLSLCICHKSGGSKTVGCEKMMALTFYWQKIYIHYSSINTIPLHTPIQPLTQHLNTECVYVCVYLFRVREHVCLCVVEKCASDSALNLDSGVSHQHQRKVRSAFAEGL